MKKSHQDICNYLGAVIGFIGALLMTIAIGEVEQMTHYDESCTGVLTGKAPEEILNIMAKCAYHPVGLKHQYLNRIGLILLCFGFLVQFSPAISLIKKWIIQKIQRFKS